MSRQRGSRPRPRPEQQRYHEQFSRRRVRAAPPPVAAAAPTERRRWAAVAAASFVLTIAFAAVVTAIVEQDRGNSDRAGTWLAVGAALAPVTFTVLVRVSRAPQPLARVLLSGTGAVAGYLLLGALVGEPTSPLVLAFGLAGAYALRLDPPHTLGWRAAGVGAAATAVLLLALVAPVAAVIVAPLLPFPALMIGDRLAASRSAA